jgi:rod shape-determining protein MreC
VAIIVSRKPIWITFAIALVIHASLISLQTSKRFDTGFVRGWILDSVAPLEKLVDRTLHGTGSIWERYFALIGVYEENQQLRSQLDELKMQFAKHQEDILEAQRLRQYVGLEDSRLGRTIIARVIGRDPTRDHQSMTIDKGRAHGIQPDSAVMTPAGIVGRVIYAGNFHSTVQLILDSQSGIGVLVLPDRRMGIIRGTGAAELELDYIDDDSQIKEGDLMITSGDDRIYPKGFPVGRIQSVGPRQRGLFKTVRILPTADMGRLEEVLCVIDKPKIESDPLQGPPSP